jgi:hypothetical protein
MGMACEYFAITEPIESNAINKLCTVSIYPDAFDSTLHHPCHYRPAEPRMSLPPRHSPYKIARERMRLQYPQIQFDILHRHGYLAGQS